ncbi:DUF2478 domain-containing protein [Antarctobacter heliothermus]|uniref:3-dehydroquinate dehydratase n=1 Tax=Antarctobacter heliothermus TaxID=74033 RepID=A0A239B395_9RHOB|nr:DUF2478 domain-containing protein [Antarctobacter heliothermus]SNS01708.1 Protein of unknown function [Antarctobacter heliothermus]
MQIAYTMAPGQGDTDLLLFQIAETLAARGHATCGTVQINTECANGPCDMDVSVLPDGPVLRISQDLGQASRGCRLDPTVLETAVGLVASRLQAGVDILIVNKFGKHEAEGRGFRTVIADAIDLEIPVLVGVNSLNLAPFLEFVGSDVTALEPSQDTILQWIESALTQAKTSGDCPKSSRTAA